MELTKEKLISLLSENNYIADIDEMAKYWTKKKPGEKVKSSKLYDNDGNHIGYDMMVDPFSEDPDSERVQIVFTCDIDQFMQEHPDVVQKLKSDYGSFRWSETKCPSDRPHRDIRVGKPLPGEEGEPISTVKQTSKDVATGEKLEGSKRIKTLFLKELRNNLTRSGENFNKVLNKRSVPAIELDNKKYFDKHTDVWSNDSVKFTTQGYNVYQSTEEFNQMVADRIFGDDVPEMSTEHLARQFNTLYSNWDSKQKKGTRTDLGTTDVYSLRRLGFTEGDTQVFMRMTFRVNGEMVGDNTFTWTITLVNEFAGRKPGSSRVDQLEKVEFNPGSLVDGKQVASIKNIQLRPGTQFTPDNTIMDNKEIVDGLIQAINEFKQKVESIRPEIALRKAVQRPSEVGGGGSPRRRMNENIFDDLIKDVIKNMKK
jgi:hypothetical protein